MRPVGSNTSIMNGGATAHAPPSSLPSSSTPENRRYSLALPDLFVSSSSTSSFQIDEGVVSGNEDSLSAGGGHHRRLSASHAAAGGRRRERRDSKRHVSIQGEGASKGTATPTLSQGSNRRLPNLTKPFGNLSLPSFIRRVALQV